MMHGQRAAARCGGGGGAMMVLADVLQPLAGAIPSSLVSPASLAAVAATVCELPGELTQHFGFECALGDATPTADFALAIVPQEGESAKLGPEHLPAAYLAHPVWDRLHQFSALWAEPGSPLRGSVRNLCLEFDLRDASPSEVPVPSAFCMRSPTPVGYGVAMAGRCRGAPHHPPPPGRPAVAGPAADSWRPTRPSALVRVGRSEWGEP
jgi:hypothetical protein